MSARGISIRGSNEQVKSQETTVPKTGKQQTFIKQEVLTDIYNDVLPHTAEQIYNLLWTNGSDFTKEYRLAQKDTDISIGEWHSADEFDGQVREITFRSISAVPCARQSATTELQHVVLSPDNRMLVFETIVQSHDVPFGSYFEVHSRWQWETGAEESCTLCVKVGAHFKKWCMMQSKIKTSVVNGSKKEVQLKLEMIKSYINAETEVDKESSSHCGVDYDKGSSSSFAVEKGPSSTYVIDSDNGSSSPRFENDKGPSSTSVVDIDNGSFFPSVVDNDKGSSTFGSVNDNRSALDPHNSSIGGSNRQAKALEEAVQKTAKLQAFIKQDVLTGIYNVVMPYTAEQIYKWLWIDGSNFTNEYRLSRKDTDIVIGQWHAADEYDGQVREITYRSICHSPMCPPHTGMTELQHAVLSPDKKVLVFEKIVQAHDVPFGSYFEVHSRWQWDTKSETSSTLDVKVGAHFKKWCLMQSKIKAGTIAGNKKEVELILEMIYSYIKSRTLRMDRPLGN